MKKAFKKATVLISAMIIAMSAGACMTLINNDTAHSVCKKLEAKYGEEFEVVKIGDRLVTSSAKTYVHPVSNSDIVFTARIDKSGNVDDDYVNHILLNSINQNIVSTFSDYGIVALSNAVVTDADVRETDRNLDLNSFTAKNNLDGILVYVAIDYNNEDPDTFISALEDATKDYDFELVVYPFLWTMRNSNYIEMILNRTPLSEHILKIIPYYFPLQRPGTPMVLLPVALMNSKLHLNNTNTC